ncbi:hypothetical protein AMR72_15395 [Flavobacterium psychrophilum]|nr:hypothetical protein AMR72_15395 [Flavobacterium psychrophilum]AOE53776.1 hypothetical protein ALW18_15385 [Flavobacterium psychrophilum]
MAQGYLLYDIERLVARLGSNDIAISSAVSNFENIIGQIQQESDTFKVSLSNAVFRLRKEKQVCLLIEKYHRATVLLIDEFLERQEELSQPVIMLRIHQILNDMLLFIEKRFSAYLNPESELPSHYVSLSQKEWKSRLKEMESSYREAGAEGLFEFVSENIMRFIHAKRHRHLPLRTLLYRKELITEMEGLSQSVKMGQMPKALHELLIYMNYNSLGYLEYYTRELTGITGTLRTSEEQAAFLKKRYKKFKHLYCNTYIALHLGKDNIKGLISGWFESQLSLLSQGKLSTAVPYGKAYKGLAPPPPLKVMPKIICTFSATQLAILLRVADQAQLIKAPSLSAVFKAVVPHLSTLHTGDLSPDSIRSKSYLFDEKDRESTIDLLQQLIKKIKDL